MDGGEEGKDDDGDDGPFQAGGVPVESKVETGADFEARGCLVGCHGVWWLWLVLLEKQKVSRRGGRDKLEMNE